MFILLLGSYDDETKKALYTMQESIANSFSDKGYYSLLMEELGLYTVSDGHILLLENRGDRSTTIYLFRPIEDVGPIELQTIDTISHTEDIEDTVYRYLTERGFCNLDIAIERMPIISPDGLFPFLVSISSVFLIVRLKEETRGGEFIELCYISRSPNLISLKGSPGIFMLKKQDVTLTSMLELILIEREIRVLEFSDTSDLLDKTANIVRNFRV